MEELSVGIYVPSYRRWNRILTQELFEECTYLVRKSQEDDYRKAGVKNIWAVEDDQINNGIKAYYYIIDNAPEDIIVIADDDIHDAAYLLTEVTDLKQNKELITSEVYRIAQIIYDLGIGMAYCSPTIIPYNYTQEFAWKGIPGAVKWINRSVFKARYDYKVAENFDIDIIMQELLVNRITLMPKYLNFRADTDTNAGGNSARFRSTQLASLTNMQAKWGKYFSFNKKNNKPSINVKR